MQKKYKNHIDKYEFVKNINNNEIINNDLDNRLKKINDSLKLSENKTHTAVENIISHIEAISHKNYNSSGIGGNYYIEAIFNDNDIKDLESLLNNFDYKIVNYQEIDYMVLEYKSNDEKRHSKDLIINLTSLCENPHQAEFYCKIYDTKNKISDTHTFINVDNESIIFHNINDKKSSNLNNILNNIQYEDFFTKYRLNSNNGIEILETSSFSKHFEIKNLNDNTTILKYISSKDSSNLEITNTNSVIKFIVNKNLNKKYIEIEFNKDNTLKKFTYDLSNPDVTITSKNNIDNNLFRLYENNIMASISGVLFIGFINDDTIPEILISHDIDVNKILDYKIFKSLCDVKDKLIEHFNVLNKINNLNELIINKAKIDNTMLKTISFIDELNNKQEVKKSPKLL